ncbi:MAG: molybdenum cofactor guanylyltransferase [Cyanobacteria bacterium K_DeepCast_35m_m2_023]|nr:molybdenum cofactor guanylyltransferase [Cyanobacteria bacterium K_DeepCast_35m_m2_023]
MLSGGASRRMGRDKALLPHPAGGTWLEHTLRQLAALQAPITVLSRHRSHGELAEAFGLCQGLMVEAIAEPPPWEGPLLALSRLAARYPSCRLLICPVDMPGLNRASLETLVAAAAQQPELIHVAHDGERLQPLLALLPAAESWRQTLAAAIADGERRWQRWLFAQPSQPVPLAQQAMRNINTPDELVAAGHAPLIV